MIAPNIKTECTLNCICCIRVITLQQMAWCFIHSIRISKSLRLKLCKIKSNKMKFKKNILKISIKHNRICILFLNNNPF